MHSSKLPLVSLMIRLTKALLMLLISAYAFLFALANLFDPETNLSFIRNSLSMRLIYPESKLKPRAITSPQWHWAALRFMTFWEIVIGVLCARGGFDLFRNLKADTQTFHKAKHSAISGLLAGLLFFFGGFQVIGSEWFGMWQSDVLWKSVSGTMRSALFLMGTLIFVSMKNDD